MRILLSAGGEGLRARKGGEGAEARGTPPENPSLKVITLHPLRHRDPPGLLATPSLAGEAGRAGTVGCFHRVRKHSAGVWIAGGFCGNRVAPVIGRGGGCALGWLLSGIKGSLQNRVFVRELQLGGNLPFRISAFSLLVFQTDP